MLLFNWLIVSIKVSELHKEKVKKKKSVIAGFDISGNKREIALFLTHVVAGGNCRRTGTDPYNANLVHIIPDRQEYMNHVTDINYSIGLFWGKFILWRY